MSAIGLSVPPGFTITTECCREYCDSASWNGSLPPALWEQILAEVGVVEEKMGASFGSASGGTPLLLSVRSGAAISMPGMMDTVLNLGLNDDVVLTLADKVRSC